MRPSSAAFLYSSSAVRIWRSALRNSCSLARFTASSANGTAIDTRMPMIATVTISSISVNP
jgi:hypothetical protein